MKRMWVGHRSVGRGRKALTNVKNGGSDTSTISVAERQGTVCALSTQRGSANQDWEEN